MLNVSPKHSFKGFNKFWQLKHMFSFFLKALIPVKIFYSNI